MTNGDIDHFNKYRIHNFHLMTSNSFQFAFSNHFNFVECLRLSKTINVFSLFERVIIFNNRLQVELEVIIS